MRLVPTNRARSTSVNGKLVNIKLVKWSNQTLGILYDPIPASVPPRANKKDVTVMLAGTVISSELVSA